MSVIDGTSVTAVAPEPITPGMFGYSLLRMGDQREFFNALMDDMAAFDVPIEGLHTETGPGVYEVAIAFNSALKTADREAARAELHLLEAGGAVVDFQFVDGESGRYRCRSDHGCRSEARRGRCRWSSRQKTPSFGRSCGGESDPSRLRPMPRGVL